MPSYKGGKTMSRDWTPQQNRWADKQLHFSKNKIAFINPETKAEELLIDPECDLAKQYPYLYFLYGYELEHFMLKELPESLVRTAESFIGKIIAYEDSTHQAISSETSLNNILQTEDMVDLNNCNHKRLLELLIKWYTGALDPDFYYRTENERLFKEKLREIGTFY